VGLNLEGPILRDQLQLGSSPLISFLGFGLGALESFNELGDAGLHLDIFEGAHDSQGGCGMMDWS